MTKTLLESAIQGMLANLDPHSTYLNRESLEELDTHATGEFSGLGLEVTMENGLIRVISPIDDTPAQRAGIEAGDLIVKLNNQPVKGMNLTEAIDLMRGPRGSEIEITIVREGAGKPFPVTLVRDTIQVASVRKRWLEPGYGYIRIAQFQADTGSEVGSALASLTEQDNLKGLVLDLRNNPGGVLGASVAVSNHFLTEGIVVYTEGRLKESSIYYNASGEDNINGLPLVVLINGGSASASEIVAGALQDHRRAIIMGTDSFGKGSVQTVVPLSENNAIKLTTALYFTPNGRSIQAKGIVPDIVVERAEVKAIKSPGQISEADLSGHLDNNTDIEQNNTSIQDKNSQLQINDNQLYESIESP